MTVVRWCEVDLCPEDLCGGVHAALDLAVLQDRDRRMFGSSVGAAAFLGDERVLPTVATNEVVCWDKDSTLGNTRQRHHLLPRNRPEAFEGPDATGWLEYAMAGENDEPMPASVLLYKMLLWQRAPGSYARRHQTHIVSGSDDGARRQTMGWLRRHGLWADAVRLRTPEDRFQDGDRNLEHMKIQYVRDLQAKGLQVTLFVEDWPPLARAIEEATGVPVLVLNPCYNLDAAEGSHQSDAPKTDAHATEFELPGQSDSESS